MKCSKLNIQNANLNPQNISDDEAISLNKLQKEAWNVKEFIAVEFDKGYHILLIKRTVRIEVGNFILK